MPSRPTARRSDRAAITTRRPDPRVWRRALRLAGGDHRRLDVEPDGTVVIHNQQIR